MTTYIHYIGNTFKKQSLLHICRSITALYIMKAQGGISMRNKKYYLFVDCEQTRIIIESLVRLKNVLIRQGRYTDCVDELIFKVANAPTEK